MKEHTDVSPAQLRQARLKELRTLIREHRHEIAKLQQELSQYERERLISAPRGTYRHRRSDGSDIEVEATVLETDGVALYIQYQIPKFLARRGEEDTYLLWLRSPEKLERFTPRA
ncbi:hypothetical protein ccbrp13_46660 [Ktedonobacteria bacterium brp13]|nr:hypothetical protein ccbrp13_46660 [Ktedonobacteria bacterium brp13]